ncbi:MAG TPA: hypothetical protein VFF29_08260 [Bacteroidota bacterium]|nr:hypothetical protein [Bacteroidota bacterium]
MVKRQTGYRMFREEVIVEKTGKSTKEWNAILDKWSASAKGHTSSAEYLRNRYKLSAWWSQAVTIRYEYERGLRK